MNAVLLDEVVDMDALATNEHRVWRRYSEAIALRDECGSYASAARFIGLSKSAFWHRCHSSVQNTAPLVILRELIDHGFLGTDRLIDQLWGHREDGGPLMTEAIFKNAIYRLRQVLRPGWNIVRLKGRGFCLEETPRLTGKAA